LTAVDNDKYVCLSENADAAIRAALLQYFIKRYIIFLVGNFRLHGYAYSYSLLL